MAAIPNPHNGYIPNVGESVRIVGACHPRMLGKIVKVVAIFLLDGIWWFEAVHWETEHGAVVEEGGDLVRSGGELGGVEPVSMGG